jgi:hypothetical protein
MRYMMLVCAAESEVAAAGDPAPDATAASVEEMTGRGVRQSGSRLGPTSSATTVRVRDGQTLLSDGPFAETSEQVLGYDFLECASLDEALQVAARHPVARWGTIEVRPVWPG